MKIYWLQPGEIDSVSGGYIYNKNIIEGIRSQSFDLELCIPGTDFPFPSKKSIEKCKAFFNDTERSSIIVIDSLILGTIPDLIEEFSAEHTIVGMIHLPLCISPSFNIETKKRFKQSEIKSFNHSKLLIVTSEFLKSEIMKMGVDEDKIHVISPGINSEIINKSYPDKPNNLLCVSKITSSKGQLDLIKALENIRHLEWNLTFCGGFDEQDNYYKNIRQRISISGMENRIVFTGEISHVEIEKYYKQADLLILTSYFETYSMVLQEAMAFKLPIISTKTGATTQTSDSQVTRFYQPGNIPQLEKQLYTLLNYSDAYKKLTQGYSNQSVKFLTWKDKAEQFLQVLSKYYGT